MRLRKVKLAEEIISGSNYILKDILNYKGKYNNLFGNNNPIHVELGMGKGNFIINNALRYPNINFIGIEKYDSVLVRAIQKLEGVNLPNLRLIQMDAVDINNVFSNEIDCLYLNFSDPWPKKRHINRRLTSEVFLKKYDSLFKKSKRIVMKTDNRHFFEFSLKSLINHGYKINNLSLNLYDDDLSLNIPTEYEMKFVAKGMIIYYIEVIK